MHFAQESNKELIKEILEKKKIDSYFDPQETATAEMTEPELDNIGTILKSGEIYHKFFKKLNDMICICSPEGKIFDVNRAGVLLLGYSSKGEFLSVENLKDIYHNPKNLKKWNDLMTERGFVKDFEATLVKKNGEIIAALVTSCAIKDKKGEVKAFANIIRDDTKNIKNKMRVHKLNVDLIDSLYNLKKTQPKLIQQEKLASIGQLAAGIAHELNNPIGFISSNFSSLKSYITIIKTYIEKCEALTSAVLTGNDSTLQSMIDDLTDFKERQKLNFIFTDIEDLVSESMEGIQRITDIVKNLRDFSRVDYESEIEQYNINEALENTLIVVKNELKYVAEIQKIFSEVPLIECVGSEINQVLLNILINAAQAIKSQERTEKGIIKIRTYKEGSYVYCEISDDGPGIRGDIMNRIFDPFFSTKEAGKGTGLGLFISYDIIVNKHGGDIIVESEREKETKFTLKLPIKSRLMNRSEGDVGIA
jgi:PAS domain S-box-containing protein